jgi:glycine/D-amino acid oxidase-like deaminating enzyme/nitrite reductase/ring-hydroxylating ferredoxin subunit
MHNQSLWEAISVINSSYPPLTTDLEVDVAIIGGGITGVTAANELIHSGKKVALFEANQIGRGTTGFSTGNLYIPVQPFYQNIEEKFNFATAKAIANSRQFAIDYIEKNTLEKNISCHFTRRPWYAYSAKKDSLLIKKEAELFKKMEIPVNQVKDLPFPFKFKSAIEIPRQARFNPLQYVISLAANLHKNGCLLFENTRIIDLQEEDFCTLKTKDATIRAKKVLLATHTPIGINPIHIFTAPYRSYVVAIKTESNFYPEGHFWNLDTPPYTLCTHAAFNENPELIMVAGSHHKTGQSTTSSHYKELELLLEQDFKVKEIVHHWSAQHYQSADYIPYIGLASPSAKHTYLATGYWADGLIYGTLAGILFSSVVLHNESPFKQIYRSTRSKIKNSSAFVFKENSNVLLQYLKDYPLMSGIIEGVKIGEGRVIEVNREKFAVSRDTNNSLHVVSAVCPHMKCIVNWNDLEKTWDCPCHGSRFTCEGKVIEGPAKADLEKRNL